MHSSRNIQRTKGNKQTISDLWLSCAEHTTAFSNAEDAQPVPVVLPIRIFNLTGFFFRGRWLVVSRASKEEQFASAYLPTHRFKKQLFPLLVAFEEGPAAGTSVF